MIIVVMATGILSSELSRKEFLLTSGSNVAHDVRRKCDFCVVLNKAFIGG